MTKKHWLIPVIIGIALIVVVTIMVGPKLVRSQSENASAKVDGVLTLTLDSYQKWDTVQGEANFIWYGPDGQEQTYTNTFKIKQPNQAYIAIHSLDGSGPDSLWISDGSKEYDINPVTKTYTATVLPGFSRDFSLLPKTLATAQSSDAVYRHPFAMIISAPVGEYLYPQWFSQGGGTYTFVDEETFLERKTWVINHQKGSDEVMAWIDEETGTILKYSQKSGGKSTVDVTFTKFVVNQPVDETTFAVPSGFAPE